MEAKVGNKAEDDSESGELRKSDKLPCDAAEEGIIFGLDSELPFGSMRALGRGAAVDLTRAHVRQNGKEEGPAGRVFTALRANMGPRLRQLCRAASCVESTSRSQVAEKVSEEGSSQ
eukprot:jgi/Tetstr1/453107/TSEL_040130.t1